MHTKPSNAGLLCSLLTLALVGLGFASLVRAQGVPSAGSRWGLAFGTAGLLLMLGAQVLYTLRKRVRSFTTGSMSLWLQAHIFCGLAGPGLVLLHTTGKFKGVAGAAAGLTLAMVASGFIGRFLYTSVPRRLDGQELGLEELVERFASVERQLANAGELPGAVHALLHRPPPPAAWHLPVTRRWLAWRYRRSVRRLLRDEAALNPALRSELAGWLADRHELQLAIQSLATARRWLSLWHLFHVPLGVVLFTVVLVHVAAALYYLPLRR